MGLVKPNRAGRPRGDGKACAAGRARGRGRVGGCAPSGLFGVVGLGGDLDGVVAPGAPAVTGDRLDVAARLRDELSEFVLPGLARGGAALRLSPRGLCGVGGRCETSSVRRNTNRACRGLNRVGHRLNYYCGKPG